MCLLLIKHLAFSIIYLKVVNFDFLLFDGKLKRGIVYKKMAMRAGDDERIANYEWPNNAFNLLNISRVLCFGILGSFLFNVNNKETRTTSIDIVLMFLSSRLSMLSLNLIRLLPIGTFDCRERYLYIGTFKNVFFCIKLWENNKRLPVVGFVLRKLFKLKANREDSWDYVMIWGSAISRISFMRYVVAGILRRLWKRRVGY